MRNPDSLTKPSPASVPGRTRDRRLPIVVAVAALLLVALLLRTFDPFGWFGAKPAGPPAAAAGDVTLLQIKESAELKVATGTFSVPVVLDSAKSGVRELFPEFLDGEKIVAIYQGDVDATIDLRGLTAEGITADPATRTITVRAPAPKLSRPAIDQEKSKVVSHSRGVLQRAQDATGEGSLVAREEMDDIAVEAIAKAADESDLRRTAEANGSQFLTALCRRMGYETITIEYVQPPR